MIEIGGFAFLVQRVAERLRALAAFGLRRMAGGQIRDCPWCKACRTNPGMRVESS